MTKLQIPTSKLLVTLGNLIYILAPNSMKNDKTKYYKVCLKIAIYRAKGDFPASTCKYSSESHPGFCGI